MNVLATSDDVKIRVINNTSDSFRILLYQADIDITARSYLVGAWRQTMLASGGTLSATLTINTEVGAAEEGAQLSVSTKLLPAPQGSKFKVFTNDKGALDIEMTHEKNPDGTISLENDCSNQKWIKVYKDGSPILSAEIRPDFNESVKIKPKITLALGQNEITTAFFDAAQLSNKYEADLSNQSYLTYTLTENIGTGKIIVDMSYDAF